MNDPYPTLNKAKQQSDENIKELRKVIEPIVSSFPDVDVLAFGSLARGDYTSGSDVDWAVVVDGRVTQDVRRLPGKIAQALHSHGISKPEEVSEFGKLSSSLEIIGSIASKHDARLSLSRRMLLLFESVSLTNGAVRDRMVEEVLQSYQSEETLSNFSYFAVPRYLLNDTDLFWRLMCTDYSGQTRARDGKQWGLRSMKMNFSRKLLAFSGILRCLECHVHLSRLPGSEIHPRDQLNDIYNRLRTTLPYSPGQTLDILLSSSVVAPIKASFERFLCALDQPEVRSELSGLKWEDADQSSTLKDLWEVSRSYHDALVNVLLSEPYRKISIGCLLP